MADGATIVAEAFLAGAGGTAGALAVKGAVDKLKGGEKKKD